MIARTEASSGSSEIRMAARHWGHQRVNARPAGPEFSQMSEMADAVRRMAARVCIPVIADADTGYGDLHNVQRTVEAFEAAGRAGFYWRTK